MKLVVLYGPPAVGKLSVTQVLAARTGFCVLHNHLLMDLSHALFCLVRVKRRECSPVTCRTLASRLPETGGLSASS